MSDQIEYGTITKANGITCPAYRVGLLVYYKNNLAASPRKASVKTAKSFAVKPENIEFFRS